MHENFIVVQVQNRGLIGAALNPDQQSYFILIPNVILAHKINLGDIFYCSSYTTDEKFRTLSKSKDCGPQQNYSWLIKSSNFSLIGIQAKETSITIVDRAEEKEKHGKVVEIGNRSKKQIK